MRVLLLCFILISTVLAGRSQVVSGVIKSPTGENVAYSYVYDSLTQRGVYSGVDGVFVLPVTNKKCSIQISHVSYAPLSLHVTATRDTFLIVQLSEIEISEVLIKGTSLKSQSKLGVNFMEKRTLENIPSFFGEPDILKTMTTLPGISGGLDLYSGIYVRGGNRDQNLFLIEGARYYSTSHAGGYLSLFNPEVISHIDIYKGVSPAKYGDAISSVIDIQLSEGNDSPKLNIDLGTLRSGFVFETTGNRKFYAFIAGRYSNIDLITGAVFKKFKDIADYTREVEFYKFGFGDLDGKLSFKPTTRTKASFNVHLGNDESATYYQGPKVNEELGNVLVNSVNGDFIHNNNVTFNFSHLFSSGISIKNSSWITHYSHTYRNEVEYFINIASKGSTLFQRDTYIYDRSSRSEISFPFGEKHLLKGGFQISSFTVNPSVGHEKNELHNTDSIFGKDDTNAFESALFLEDLFQLNDHTTLKAGIRSSWLNSGDTSFFYLEPHIQLNYELSDDWSWQLGGSMNRQAFHDLVQVYGTYEKESWILSNKTITPQGATQISTGLFGKLPGTAVDLSVEFFYKKMDHLLYLNPIGFDTKSILDYLYKDGIGKSYGGEFLLQKNSGKIQWTLAYTLSWSKRRFESLNNGDWFNFDFDRRHDINLGIHYFSSKKNIWNVNYIYQTGRPFTMPLALVGQTNFYNKFYVIGDINNATMPDYRRFDIAYKRVGKMLGGHPYESTFSVMNLFCRKNPYSVYVDNNNLYMKSIYLVIPSINIKISILKNAGE